MKKDYILHPGETKEEVKDKFLAACLVIFPFLIMVIVMAIALFRRLI